MAEVRDVVNAETTNNEETATNVEVKTTSLSEVVHINQEPDTIAAVFGRDPDAQRPTTSGGHRSSVLVPEEEADRGR